MDFAGFAFAVLLIELTPGPNMAWLVALSLGHGKRAGLAAVAGVALGLTVNAVLSSLGLSALLTAYPELGRWIGFAGAAMMVWFAWNAWHDASESSTGRLPSSEVDKHFIVGFALNLLNVKAALFFLTVVPQFVSVSGSSWTQILILGFVSVIIATLVHLVLIFGASHARMALAKPGRTRNISRSLSVLMLAVAGWFVWGALA
ncbi:LysE family translocator [Pontixanthobacter gangjinensis]|uniref:LysE family transporter n=1 Tax=Pontixanthobacter gangjinensis TaxID=1028742 RepID=A0A6I4SMT1_9SPHN|nr:LysE family translocator [Pontixanthobacter gangjinensis]MXO56052.1 LysE family transporter [Pontixanthobacter gangjinensis]